MAAIKENGAPLIVITGPTGSGKSGLALDLAERYSGEIICADSRTVYRGMDIGTAKPSKDDQSRVPHHLLDVVNPDERFTAYDFQRLAREAITGIRQRGRVPFLVGGTGLYIDSVLLDYQFVDANEQKRKVLSEKSVEELITMIKTQHIALPENYQNKRHLVNAILRQGETPEFLNSPRENTIVVAITSDKTELESRLRKRANEMLGAGVIDEAKFLAGRYRWDCEAMTGNIYSLIREYLEGAISQESLTERVTIRDRQLAKRQITWLKRHDFVQWLSLEDAESYLNTILTSHRGR